MRSADGKSPECERPTNAFSAEMVGAVDRTAVEGTTPTRQIMTRIGSEDAQCVGRGDTDSGTQISICADSCLNVATGIWTSRLYDHLRAACPWCSHRILTRMRSCDLLGLGHRDNRCHRLSHVSAAFMCRRLRGHSL